MSKKDTLWGIFLVDTFLHLVDGLDKVEEGFGAFGFVGDFFGGAVGGFEDGVIAEIFENIAIKIELLESVHVQMVEKRD